MTCFWPPISEYLTGGNSKNSERNAEGRTDGSDAWRSAMVNVNRGGEIDETADDGFSANHRFIASVPASRTTALKSAPT
jgi:hypothetical protein